MRLAARLPLAVAWFQNWLQLYLFQVCLLQIYLLNLSSLAGRQAGKLHTLIAQLQHFAHLLEKLRMRIVALPAPAIAKFDNVLLPTLDQDEPFAGDTVVRTLLPFRHEEKAKTAVDRRGG
jgi:hypothetical protein